MGLDSKILVTRRLQDELRELCEFPTGQKWQLKYRASRDGFHSYDFHSRCDGIKNTLTIIKSTKGQVFGGFTEKPWDSENGCLHDDEVFIFSLINKDQIKYKDGCSVRTIICDRNLGPGFGFQELLILPDSNKNSKSLFDNCNESFYFQTNDIEVFTKA